MAITSAAGLLAAWEAGLAEPPPGRALLLHRTARPDTDTASLRQLPLGERESDLFALRRTLFGERMQVRLGCQACGEDMEFELDAGELAGSLGGRGGLADRADGTGGRAGSADGSGGSSAGHGGVGAAGLDGGREGSADGSGGSSAGRAEAVTDPSNTRSEGLGSASGGLPTGRDGAVAAGLNAWRAGSAAGSGGGPDGSADRSSGPDGSAEVPGGPSGGFGQAVAHGAGGSVVRVRQGGWDVEFRLPGVADLAVAARAVDPRGALLARCLVSAVHDGVAVAAGDLPGPVQRRIADAVEAADPGADLALNVACPECGAATRAELDIASYLWTELDAWARDVLLDVHLLATAYGWSEPEILALSPLRRRYYLELCADV